MKYKAVFKGRRVNAQGIRYWAQAPSVGANEDEARLNLYDRWEHIECLVLVPVPDHQFVPEGEIPKDI